MTKPLKEDFIIRIKSRIDQPAEPEGKPEYVELMTRGSLTGGGTATILPTGRPRPPAMRAV